MKQWNGLMKKEWVSMKGWLYGTVGASFLITLIIPFVVPMLLEGSVGALISGLIPFWILISLILPVIVLLNSLKKEMGHPDIWLHSPVSIFKMFGSKAVFAGFVGIVNLLIVTLLGLFHFKLSTIATNFTSTIGVLATFILVFFMVSLMVMCIGLFVKVLYYVTKPYLKVFTITILFVFIFASAWAIERIIEKVKGTVIYEKIATFGPIGNPSKGGFFIEKEHFFFEVDETIFHIGDLLMNASFIVLLFITAAVLFEKKVRL